MKKTLVSVIIPTKNEAANIGRALKSIRNQRYQGKVEVIVVDNYSIDRTVKIAKRFLSRNRLFFKSCQVVSSGPERSSQRNLGAKLAKGSYLLFLDADMAASTELIDECVKLAVNSISAPMLVVKEHALGYNFLGKALALEKNCYKDLNWVQAARFFPKSLFVKFGGYDSELVAGEDWDLTQRLTEKGVPTLMTEKATLFHHEVSQSLLELFKKELYYIKYMDLYVLKNPRAFSYQGSLLYRGLIYTRAWQDLVAHPLQAVSFIVYKAVVWSMWQWHRQFNRKI